MKKLLLIYLFTVFSVKAQTLYSLQNYDGGLDLPINSYVQDTENDYNLYEGTWLYENNGIEFKIELKKRTKFYHPRRKIYIDMLVGNYSYTVNGLEMVNTLNYFTTTELYGNTINDRIILENDDYPVCNSCNVNERRISLDFKDPTVTNIGAEIVFRYKIINGVEHIEAILYETTKMLAENGSLPEHIRVPIGNYLFVKQ